MTDEDSLCCMALKLGLPKRLLKESVEKRKEDICQRVFWLKTITLWYAYHLMTVVMLGYLILISCKIQGYKCVTLGKN